MRTWVVLENERPVLADRGWLSLEGENVQSPRPDTPQNDIGESAVQMPFTNRPCCHCKVIFGVARHWLYGAEAGVDADGRTQPVSR